MTDQDTARGDADFPAHFVSKRDIESQVEAQTPDVKARQLKG